MSTKIVVLIMLCSVGLMSCGIGDAKESEYGCMGKGCLRTLQSGTPLYTRAPGSR